MRSKTKLKKTVLREGEAKEGEEEVKGEGPGMGF